MDHPQIHHHRSRYPPLSNEQQTTTTVVPIFTPLIAQQDGLKRELKDAQNEIVRLKQAYDQQVTKVDKLSTELITLRKQHSTCTAQTDKLQKEVFQARQARAEADTNLQNNNEYIKKLESKLVNGKQGNFLLDQNAKLRTALQTLKTENEVAKTTVDQQRFEIEKASREIEILATALEMRADELSLGGDLRSGLLYEVAHRREEVRRLKEELDSKIIAYNEKEQQIHTLQENLSRSQTDVATLAERATGLSADLNTQQSMYQRLQETYKNMEKERDHSLGYVSKHSQDLAEAILRAENLDKQVKEYRNTITELQSAKATAEARVAQIKNVQDITNATLHQERTALKEANEKLEKNEAALNHAKADAAAVRSQMNALASSHQELQVAVAARAQEVLSLQVQVRQLTAELTETSNRYVTSQRTTVETNAANEALTSRYQRELDNLIRERDNALSTSKDATARATVLMVENGRLSEMLSNAQGEINALRNAKSNLVASNATEIASLRDQLIAEQAARHQARAAQLAIQEERDRELREKIKLQRQHDLELAAPKTVTPPIPVSQQPPFVSMISPVSPNLHHNPPPPSTNTQSQTSNVSAPSNYVPVSPSKRLPSPGRNDSSARTGLINARLGMTVAGTPSKVSGTTLTAPPPSPGALALQEATALYRTRRAQQQQKTNNPSSTAATTGEYLSPSVSSLAHQNTVRSQIRIQLLSSHKSSDASTNDKHSTAVNETRSDREIFSTGIIVHNSTAASITNQESVNTTNTIVSVRTVK